MLIPMTSGAYIILTSVSNDSDAERIAKTLVEKHLAACVQISAEGHSVYRWQERIESEAELYLSIKTTVDKMNDAVDWLESNHPYETPEILCLSADASEKYLQWMRASVG